MLSLCFIHSSWTCLFSISLLSTPSIFLMHPYVLLLFIAHITCTTQCYFCCLSYFLLSPSLVTFQFKWINLLSLLRHSSIHYAAFLPSHFNSLTPLIPHSSLPQHTMYLSPPLCLSTTVFHPLTSLSSLIFPQPFPCFYIRPSIYSLPTFFFWSPPPPALNLPLHSACVHLRWHMWHCACVHVCFLFRARCSLLRRLEWWRW